MTCRPKSAPAGVVTLPGIVRCRNCTCAVKVGDACHCHAINTWHVDALDGIAYLQCSMPQIISRVDHDASCSGTAYRPSLEKLT